MIALLLAAAALIVQAAPAPACAICHPAIARKHSESHHAKALARIGDSAIAVRLSRDSVSERNGAAFEYRPASGTVTVTASIAGESATGNLEWLFGAGAQGQTPVGRFANGQYFEHRLSYYPPKDRLARTFGHPPGPSTDPAAALGLIQANDTVFRCFDCHAAGVRPGPNLESIQPGVTCERCHGTGELHRLKPPARILNPGKLNAKESVTFCAECHRAPAQSPEAPEITDPVSVRFAPIGLTASRCFQLSAGRKLVCTTCHDPHENARPRSDTAFYAERCRACHPAAQRPKSACPRQAQSGCVGCHMPQVELTPFLRFTDHRIRRPNSSE
ncbi:MAG: multiheme c-type cytochrome [Bryobacteraceae bacterium]